MYTKGPAVLPASGRGAYVGVFGGGGSRSSTNVSQFGTAFFVEAVGGPMAIDATGQTSSGGVGFGGAHLGYEWSYGTYLRPALEIEGFYLAGNQPRATLVNPTDRLPNTPSSILSRPAPRCFWRIWLSASRRPIKTSRPISAADSGRATSPSTAPRPHRPTRRSLASTTSTRARDFLSLDLAAQVEGRCALRPRRQLALICLASTAICMSATWNQVFGSTVDPTHVPTSPWTTSFGGTSHHLAAGGVGFSF